MKLSTAILTGGRNGRMGRDKAFLSYGNKSFLENLYDEMESFDEVLISVAEPENYQQFPNLLVDEFSQAGPLGGIYTLA